MKRRISTRTSTLAFLLLALWLGCTDAPQPASESNSEPMSENDPVSELDLSGQSEADVRNAYGEPSGETSFSVYPGVTLPEFQSGLYDAVVANLSEGDSVMVRQWRWEGERHRAVWFVEEGEQWTVADALEWDRDVQF